MDIDGIQAKLRIFASERDWERYHTPKNLSMALVVEATELLEIFQWMTVEESIGIKDIPDLKQDVADEIADILNYTIRLSDLLDIDINKAVLNKMDKNSQKYPPRGSKTPRSKREIYHD